MRNAFQEILSFPPSHSTDNSLIAVEMGTRCLTMVQQRVMELDSSRLSIRDLRKA